MKTLKLMAVLFLGGANIESAASHVEKWNEKSGEEVHPDTTPHERLEGVFTFGGATVRNEGSKKPKSFPYGVVFMTTYKGNSWAPSCLATCFAFENWLNENGVKAILVTHQEEPPSEAEPGDER